MATQREVVLIVDDDHSVAEYHASLLNEIGYLPIIECDPTKVKDILLDDPSIRLVLLDMRMPQMHGLEVLSIIKRLCPYVGVIIATVVNDIAQAVQATKSGAYNYLLKPLQADRLKQVIESYLHNRPVSVSNDIRFRSFMTNYKPMEEIFRKALIFAEQDVPVLITGETGTGKEILAELIHTLSKRKLETFIPVNMSAISSGIFESELFGHTKGSFTGSTGDKIGYFEKAKNGTLFLDEIGELQLEHQAKLLRVIQSKMFNKVGSTETNLSSARCIFATNRNLKDCVEKQTFREDLFYRISNYTIHLPPLRERIGDIEVLSKYFVAKYNVQYGRLVQGISYEAMMYLNAYDYPGNVRELEGIISSAVLLEESTYISTENLPPHVKKNHPITGQNSLTSALAADELDLKTLKHEKILKVLSEMDGNQTKAAKKLGISRVTLNRLIKKYLSKDKQLSTTNE